MLYIYIHIIIYLSLLRIYIYIYICICIEREGERDHDIVELYIAHSALCESTCHTGTMPCHAMTCYLSLAPIIGKSQMFKQTHTNKAPPIKLHTHMNSMNIIVNNNNNNDSSSNHNNDKTSYQYYMYYQYYLYGY